MVPHKKDIVSCPGSHVNLAIFPLVFVHWSKVTAKMCNRANHIECSYVHPLLFVIPHSFRMQAGLPRVSPLPGYAYLDVVLDANIAPAQPADASVRNCKKILGLLMHCLPPMHCSCTVVEITKMQAKYN